MPFAADFHDTYRLGIKAACDSAGAYCERVDEQVYEGTIIDRIYNQIASADFIVADMTGRNPNVFYEVGYSHAINKKVILLTQNTEDIPFDLASYPHIVYANISSLKAELPRRLSWLLQNPSSENTYFEFPLRFLIDGKPIQSLTELKLSRFGNNTPTSSFEFGFDILNSPERIISTVNFRLGIIVDPIINDSYFQPSIFSHTSFPSDKFHLPDGRLFHLIQNDFTLLPGGLSKIHCRLEAFGGETHLKLGQKLELTLRILSDAGINDIPLSITLT